MSRLAQERESTDHEDKCPAKVREKGIAIVIYSRNVQLDEAESSLDSGAPLGVYSEEV
jgi:hypothetical protein